MPALQASLSVFCCYKKIQYDHFDAIFYGKNTIRIRACDQLNLKPALMSPLGLINNYLKTNHKMRALKGRMLVSPGL